MFTGLVAGRGTVIQVERSTDGLILTVETPLAAGLADGDSIAVNGVCLTVTTKTDARFEAEVMNETLDRTSLVKVQKGHCVNLELAMRASDRLGGHVLQGHVDTIGSVMAIMDDGFSRRIDIACPSSIMSYIVEKGCIAIDGVSLTVASMKHNGFQVSVIPETLERTSLGRAKPGDTVNLEADVMAKYAEKFHLSSARGTSDPQESLLPRADTAKILALAMTNARSPNAIDTGEEVTFATIEEALEEMAAGRIVVVVDDEDRENEGDLVMAAEHVTPEAVNFMATHGRGWICLTLTPERCDELGLEMMTANNKTPFSTPFTVTIEARDGVTTGISAADRARTIRTAIDPSLGPEHIIKGGHINPLRAKPGGVLERTGHTEASVDMARLAGCTPAGMICEIMNEDGTMSRVPDLKKFCRIHGLKLVTIAALVEYRRRHDKLIERVVSVTMPTKFGAFVMHGYRGLRDGHEHVALVKGDVTGKSNVLVRIHSSCMTGDVFHSMRCDCGDQLATALSMIEREGAGVVIYLAQEGRGIGLLNKLKAYRLQEQGYDTIDANEKLGFPADLRDYGIGAQILDDLGIQSVRVATNNPNKLNRLEHYGVRVISRVPLVQGSNPHNHAYLLTKATRLGHMFDASADTDSDPSNDESDSEISIVIRGVVVHGAARGRALGYPTANVALTDGAGKLPPDGVYAGWLRRESGETLPSAISIGRKPTFHGNSEASIIEAHVLDWSGNLYDENVTVTLSRRLRKQLRFDDVDSLVAQMSVDCNNVRQLLLAEVG